MYNKFKIFLEYESTWIAKPLVIRFPEIKGNIEIHNRRKYLTIINIEKITVYQ